MDMKLVQCTDEFWAIPENKDTPPLRSILMKTPKTVSNEVDFYPPPPRQICQDLPPRLITSPQWFQVCVCSWHFWGYTHNIVGGTPTYSTVTKSPIEEHFNKKLNKTVMSPGVAENKELSQLTMQSFWALQSEGYPTPCME